VAVIKGAELLGINMALFKDNCQALVSALKAKSHGLSEVGVLLREAHGKCIRYVIFFVFTVEADVIGLHMPWPSMVIGLETEFSGWPGMDSLLCLSWLSTILLVSRLMESPFPFSKNVLITFWKRLVILIRNIRHTQS
jgi:hypothetical protein